MSNYIDISKFKGHVGEEFFISQLSKEDGTINEELFTNVCDDAEAEINGYLRGQYALPLTRVDKLITTICGDVIKYRLYKRRDEANMPDAIIKCYQNSVKILEKIQSRKLFIDVTDSSVSSVEEQKKEQNKTILIGNASEQKFGSNFTKMNEDYYSPLFKH